MTEHIYKAPGVKVTVELEDSLRMECHNPSTDDIILFVKDRLTIHMRRGGDPPK